MVAVDQATHRAAPLAICRMLKNTVGRAKRQVDPVAKCIFGQVVRLEAALAAVKDAKAEIFVHPRAADSGQGGVGATTDDQLTTDQLLEVQNLFADSFPQCI